MFKANNARLGSLVLLLPIIFSLAEDRRPWEGSRCVNLWGKPEQDWGALRTRELFDMPKYLNKNLPARRNPFQGTNLETIAGKNVTWPPHERGTVEDFWAAVGTRRSPLGEVAPQHQLQVHVKVNHDRRLVYIKNLKAGSSTIDNLLQPLWTGKAFRGKRYKDDNHTKVMLECSETYQLSTKNRTCDPYWTYLSGIPDSILENYFIFSFVRDPFARVVSAFHEVGAGAFTNIIKGLYNKVGSNAHFMSQIGLLSRPAHSSHRPRLDFVGNLEELQVDWPRLAPVWSDDAVHLSPRERQKLILPKKSVTPIKLDHHRSSTIAGKPTSPIFVPNSNTERYSVLHELLLCRRYIQDLVCFNLGIPKSCIEWPELVLDIEPQPPHRLLDLPPSTVVPHSSSSTNSPSWEKSSCLTFWGPPQDPNGPILVRERFDEPKSFVKPPDDVAALLAAEVSWPPVDRGKFEEFSSAVGSRKISTKSQLTRLKVDVTCKIHHDLRLIYIKNLKAGSTTVDNLISKMWHSGGWSKQLSRANPNETSLALQCMENPVVGPVCSPHWMKVNLVPEEVMENYFVFTFVRDPFTRVVSAHHEVGVDPFTEILRGHRNRYGENPHYLSQTLQITRSSFSGKRIRLDFIGRLETITEDWARMLPVLAENARALPPITRRGIVEPNPPKVTSEVVHHRSSGTASENFVPKSHGETFTAMHVLLACRRYIQDFACFDIKIPQLCIDRPELVLDFE